MENYIRWKLMGGQKLMKSNVIPHKFECQNESQLVFSKSTPRKAIAKRKRTQEPEDIQSTSSSSSVNEAVEKLLEYKAVEQPQQCKAVESPKNINRDTNQKLDFSSSDSTESTECEHINYLIHFLFNSLIFINCWFFENFRISLNYKNFYRRNINSNNINCNTNSICQCCSLL